MNELSQAGLTASRASRVQKVTSPSGVTAWLVEDYAVPIIAVDFAFRAGAAQDPLDKFGAVMLMSALLDEGAGALDGAAFHNALDDKAIELSFSADRDHVSGHVRALAGEAASAFTLLGLALNEPRFDEDALERVKAQMVAGLKHEANDPDSVSGRAFRAAAFPNHPYGHAARGTIESVPGITRVDVASLHSALLARDNLCIAVVGAISAATLAAELERVFAPLAQKARTRAIAPVTMAALGETRVSDLDLTQSTVRFGRPGLDLHDADYSAAMVVNHVLGGGIFTARLFREVREKRGLAYSVYSQLANYDRCDLLTGATTTKNERVAESLEVISREIKALGQDGPTAEELDKAKRYLTGSYALRFDTSSKIAGQLVFLQIAGFDVTQLDRRNVEIEAVTMADAQRAAARLFGDGKLLVAIAGRPQGL